MTITHHPDPATLITCSAGAQPEALCAVVVSHIAICPACWAEFHRMEAIGAALFADLQPHPLDDPDPPPSKKPTPSADKGRQNGAAPPEEVPASLAGIIGTDLEALAWEPIGPGAKQYVVRLSTGARGDLRLVRLAPGVSLAKHGHRGEELTLVLRGACRDGQAIFRVGDFSDLDDEIRHQPTAIGDQECILLIASEQLPDFAYPTA